MTRVARTRATRRRKSHTLDDDIITRMVAGALYFNYGVSAVRL